PEPDVVAGTQHLNERVEDVARGREVPRHADRLLAHAPVRVTEGPDEQPSLADFGRTGDLRDGTTPFFGIIRPECELRVLHGFFHWPSAAARSISSGTTAVTA